MTTIRQTHAHKILSAHATKVQGRLANELHILDSQIHNNNTKAHPDLKHVATSPNKFTVTDHHGSHPFLVLEAFKGPSYNPGQNLPIPFVKNMAR